MSRYLLQYGINLLLYPNILLCHSCPNIIIRLICFAKLGRFLVLVITRYPFLTKEPLVFTTKSFYFIQILRTTGIGPISCLLKPVLPVRRLILRTRGEKYIIDPIAMTKRS